MTNTHQIIEVNPKGEESPIFKALLQCTKSIITEYVNATDARFEDYVYKDIYIHCQNYAKNLENTLAANNRNQADLAQTFGSGTFTIYNR